MKPMVKMAILGALTVFGMVFASTASAQCALPNYASIQRSAQGTGRFTPDSSSLAADQESSADSSQDGRPADGGIVGFWKSKFVSEGSPGIPDGTVIDDGFVQWHDDNTEIMNSSRPPATGNFCLGVWEKSEPSEYKLNHFGLSSDPDGNFIGPAQLREDVILDRRGNHYVGTFTIDQYDALGNLLAHIQGQVTARRITVHTPVKDVL